MAEKNTSPKNIRTSSEGELRLIHFNPPLKYLPFDRFWEREQLAFEEIRNVPGRRLVASIVLSPLNIAPELYSREGNELHRKQSPELWIQDIDIETKLAGILSLLADKFDYVVQPEEREVADRAIEYHLPEDVVSLDKTDYRNLLREELPQAA